MRLSTAKLTTSLTTEEEAELATKQTTAYFNCQAELIEGLAEGKPQSEAENVLGGLGLVRTKQVVEERSLQGKCGNVLCTNPLEEDMRHYNFKDAVKFISNNEVVKAEVFDQYCSVECFKFFEHRIIPKRPAADVWELQQSLIERTTRRSSSSENVENPAKPLQSIVSQVKEKEVVAKPKKKFNTLPNLDTVMNLARKPKSKKSVSFNQTVNVCEFKVNEESREVPSQVSEDQEDDTQEGSDDQEIDEQEGSESQEIDEQEDEDLAMMAFFDPSSKPDDIIENSGLNAFILCWDFLTRVATDFTRLAISERQVREWRAPSSMDESDLEERRKLLLEFMKQGIDVCNFSASDVFVEKATSEISRILPTLDLTRAIPKYQVDVWALVVCVILGALSETGHFTGFDFERNDIVQCFSSVELAALDAQQLDTLKTVLHPVPEAVGSNQH